MLTPANGPGGGVVAPVPALPDGDTGTPRDRDARPAPIPCAARPSTDFVHPEGQCRCFAGGPAPEFAPVRDLGVAS